MVDRFSTSRAGELGQWLLLLLMLLILLAPLAARAAEAPLAKWQAMDKSGQVWLRDATARVEAIEGTFDLTDPRYKLGESTSPADDAFGQEPWRVVTAIDSRKQMDLKLFVRQNKRGDVLVKMWCRNRSDKPMNLMNFILVDGFRPGSWENGMALSFGPDQTLHGVSPFKKGLKAGGEIATAANRPPFTGGFVATSHYHGFVDLVPAEGGLKVTARNAAD
jgi:hypothetical protein